MKDWRKEWFFMTTSQKWAYYLALISLLIVLSLYFFLPETTSNQLIQQDANQLTIYSDSLIIQSKKKSKDYFKQQSHQRLDSASLSSYEQAKSQGFADHLTPFPFDPNQIDSVNIVALGLPDWMAHNILRYRHAGKLFKEVQEFSKIYGLTPQQYEKLYPYIQIDSLWLNEQLAQRKQLLHSQRKMRSTKIQQLVPHTKDVGNIAQNKNIDTAFQDTTSIYHPSSKTYQTIQKYELGHIVELNTADTTELKHIPKVGSGISKMIYYYRLKLGGYTSITQLQEIHLDTTYLKQWVHVDPIYIKKLNVNKASLSQLYHHPYCTFRQAKYIVDYRKKHGIIHSIEELGQSSLFTKNTLTCLCPYLSF